MCSLPCLCLDLHAFVLLAMFMLRFTCFFSPCHACVLKAMLVAMPWASIALFPLDISLSCVLALIGGV